MDPSSTPWRALEDSPGQAQGPAEPAAPAGRILRSTVLAGGGAALLAIAAFWLAFGSGAGGGVSVDATTALASDASRVVSGTASSLGPGDAAPGGSVVIVEIVGAVERPGVYRLPPGARIGDLIESAGGYGPRVDTDRAGRELNLAAPLHDGDQVRVPSRDDPTASAAAPEARAPSKGGRAGPVDLNHATAAELDALPGIGPVTAAKIIASRDEQPFAAIADLRARKLVGEKTFANLKDLVAVR